jgi:hypothetical protein
MPRYSQDRRDAATQRGQNELEAAADSITPLASADTDHYYAVGIDLARKLVVVWRKGGADELSAETKALYAATSTEFPVEFRNSWLSLAETETVQASVFARRNIIVNLIGCLDAGEPLVVQYSPKGAVPDLELFARLGITKSWPHAAMAGAVEFRPGEIATFRRRQAEQHATVVVQPAVTS